MDQDITKITQEQVSKMVLEHTLVVIICVYYVQDNNFSAMSKYYTLVGLL